MRQYTFESVWPSPSADIREEAVSFWLEESALSKGKAMERARQLLVVCRDAEGTIAAVSTAIPSLVKTLGLHCFYFRAFVGRAHRAQGLRGSKVIHKLVHESYDVLNDRFQRGIDSHCVGLHLEIESRSIQRHRNELVWTDDGANVVFLGVLPNGRQSRVWYFEKAKLP